MHSLGSDGRWRPDRRFAAAGAYRWHGGPDYRGLSLKNFAAAVTTAEGPQTTVGSVTAVRCRPCGAFLTPRGADGTPHWRLLFHDLEEQRRERDALRRVLSALLGRRDAPPALARLRQLRGATVRRAPSGKLPPEARPQVAELAEWVAADCPALLGEALELGWGAGGLEVWRCCCSAAGEEDAVPPLCGSLLRQLGFAYPAYPVRVTRGPSQELLREPFAAVGPPLEGALEWAPPVTVARRRDLGEDFLLALFGSEGLERLRDRQARRWRGGKRPRCEEGPAAEQPPLPFAGLLRWMRGHGVVAVAWDDAGAARLVGYDRLGGLLAVHGLEGLRAAAESALEEPSLHRTLVPGAELPWQGLRLWRGALELRPDGLPPLEVASFGHWTPARCPEQPRGPLERVVGILADGAAANGTAAAAEVSLRGGGRLTLRVPGGVRTYADLVPAGGGCPGPAGGGCPGPVDEAQNLAYYRSHPDARTFALLCVYSLAAQ